ncbi:hypothetical protein C8R44DRAFT_893676 [Mycena epipterygia]|nr:hypothetical protein C8R44DRAFT_893676 [Mycena epipterygia]
MSSTLTLPTELERHIFEIATFIHLPSAPALILVAHRVKIWIEPLLYQVLRITKTSRKCRIAVKTISSLIESRPAAFFHDHVRHLSIEVLGQSTDNEIAPLLAACDAVVDVQIVTGSSILLPILGALPLQRLSADLLFLFPGPSGLDFGHPIFTNVTHLSLYGHSGHGWDTWSGLAQIPGLTHLAFRDNSFDAPMCHSVLLHCKLLQVLANLLASGSNLDWSVRRYATVIDNPRFVMLRVPSLLEDWEVGARGGEDRWVRASELSELVRKRHSGEVKGGYFPLLWNDALNFGQSMYFDLTIRRKRLG